jgi:1,3-beta-glucan synthase component
MVACELTCSRVCLSTYVSGVVVFLGTLNKQLTICQYNSAGQFIGGQPGCYNLVPVFDWIKRCIISIFLVFFIAFLPLFMQGTVSCLLVCSGFRN